MRRTTPTLSAYPRLMITSGELAGSRLKKQAEPDDDELTELWSIHQGCSTAGPHKSTLPSHFPIICTVLLCYYIPRSVSTVPFIHSSLPAG